LGKVLVVEKYLKECRRVLKPGGVGVIYFSRLIKSGNKIEDWLQDLQKEKEAGPPGYVQGDVLTRVNVINLQMAMWFVEELALKAGLTPVGRAYSMKSEKVVGGQHGIVFKKE
jgi:hypothetical protein